MSSTMSQRKLSYPFRGLGDKILRDFLVLSLVYGGVHWAVDGDWLPRPAAAYCPAYSDDCQRPDLFSFQVASQIAQLYLGLSGFYYWHVGQQAHTRIPTTPAGRLFEPFPEAQRLCAAIMAFQAWDFVFSWKIPEHATVVFLAHHLLSGLTAYCSLRFDMAHHYAVFFGGCSEISSIFLVVCDFDVYFPSSNMPAIWSAVVFFNQVAFTVLFVVYRIVGWWNVSWQLWKDVVSVLCNGTAHKLRPGKGWFLYWFLAMDLMLGGLQLYWFIFGMIPKILEILDLSGIAG